MVSLLKPIHAKVNLIPFNPWPGSIYKCSSAKTIKDFADEICNNGGITATVRHARGQDILAACGQLKSNSERIKREKVKKLILLRNIILLSLINISRKIHVKS